ncbi:MAG: 4'-phosphopantetheinyl transferase superfamily protein [Anaerolineae bacterium]|nr:4'-phosphopantetheinyl transferase superfamily protein [Anaerolineae bacterium]
MTTPIHWLLHTADPPTLEAWAWTNLAPAERAHLAALRFENRRDSFLLGRCAAKTLISRAIPALGALSPANIAIHNQPDGAPYVEIEGAGRLPGCLSLSHRDGRAACAWSADPALRHGIDLERIESRHPAFAGDYLTTAENAFAITLPESQRPLWITLAWSAREAALKALGTGLRLDTRRLAVSLPELAALEPAGVWQPLAIAVDAGAPAVLPGWWQRRGEFMLTLVTMGSTPDIALVEHMSPSG